MLFGSNAPDTTVESTTHRQAMFSAQPLHETCCIVKRRDAADITSG